MVAPVHDGGKTFKYHKPNCLKRHVSNLIVIVPAEVKEDAVGSDDEPEPVENVVHNEMQ